MHMMNKYVFFARMWRKKDNFYNCPFFGCFSTMCLFKIIAPLQAEIDGPALSQFEIEWKSGFVEVEDH